MSHGVIRYVSLLGRALWVLGDAVRVIWEGGGYTICGYR